MIPDYRLYPSFPPFVLSDADALLMDELLLRLINNTIGLHQQPVFSLVYTDSIGDLVRLSHIENVDFD
jgi:hypothetical protein